MRRTFRRHIHKTLAENVQPILQEANFVFDKGEYGRAAELFENIARRGQLHRFHQAGDRVLTDLNSRGLKNEAAEMERWIRKLTPPLPSFEAQKPARPGLPTHCPSCGAPLNPGEVEWPVEFTAECAYCGSPVR